VVVKLNVGVNPRAGEAGAVELGRVKRYHFVRKLVEKLEIEF